MVRRTIVMNDDTDKAALELEVSLNWRPGEEIIHAFVDSRAFTFKARRIPEGYRRKAKRSKTAKPLLWSKP